MGIMMTFDSPRTRCKIKVIKIILTILLGLLLIVIMSSCAGTGGYQKAEFIPWLEPTFEIDTEYSEKVELTQSMSQFKIKTTANWEL